MMQALGGIQPHPAAKGFDKVLIKPRPPANLGHFGARFGSVRGEIEVKWSWGSASEDGKARGLSLEVTVPPNVQVRSTSCRRWLGAAVHAVTPPHCTTPWPPSPLLPPSLVETQRRNTCFFLFFFGVFFGLMKLYPASAAQCIGQYRYPGK